ncbi:MAG: hypothetical protein KatS3mg121_1040 [Gammaproteobacteria bacterium]|nr:MAG: hypothetical protein KatS3mg121_1040 [Gammaproteobacteria bacterium]
MSETARAYIRHPSDLPIRYRVQDGVSGDRVLKNVSRGGLCFVADRPLLPGQRIEVEIPVARPPFRAEAVVVWSRSQPPYETGVRFLDEHARYTLRLVEQICYIEHYRREILKHERRRLSGEEAAREWIEKYADRFPM